MKTPLHYFLPVICSLTVAACGPRSTETTDSQTTTTKTTVTTTASETPPPVPPTAPPLTTLTQTNLDRIQHDMSQAEVEAILGQPTNSQSEPIPIVGGTKTTYTYENGTSAVTIIFKNNQMQEKSGTFGP